MLLISKGVIREMLDNGLVILAKRVEASSVVTVLTHVRTGILHDPPALFGLNELLCRLFLDGSEKYSSPRAVEQVVRAVGGYSYSYSNLVHSVSRCVVPAGAFSEALSIQTDAAHSPLFESAQVERRFSQLLSEGDLRGKSPILSVTSKLHELAFQSHLLGKLRFDISSELGHLGPQELLARHRLRLRPNNTTIVVVGNLDIEPTLKAVSERYADLPPVSFQRPTIPREPLQTAPRLLELSHDTPSSELAIGFRAPGGMGEDQYALQVLQWLLNQKLLDTLTGESSAVRQLFERLRCTYRRTATGGIFQIAATLPPSEFEKTEQAVFSMLANLQRELLPEPVIQRARSCLAARFLSTHQSLDEQAAALAYFEALGGHHLIDVVLGKLRSVTSESLQRACRHHLRFEQSSIIHSRAASDPAPPMDLKSLCLNFQQAVGLGRRRPRLRWKERIPTLRSCRVSGGPDIFFSQASHSSLLALGIFFDGGCRDEAAHQHGWTRLLLDLWLHHDISDRIQAFDAAIKPILSRDYFGLAMSCHRSSFRAIWKLALELVHASEHTDMAIGRTVERLVRPRGNVAEGYRCLDLVLRALYGEHSYGRFASLPGKKLSQHGTAEFAQWSGKVTARQRQLVSVVGDVQPQELLEQVSETWLPEPVQADASHSSPPPPKQAKICVAGRKAEGHVQFLAFPACPAIAPERGNLLLLQSALEDENWGIPNHLVADSETIRVSSVGPLWGKQAGALCLRVASGVLGALEARGRVVEILERLRNEPMPPEILARAAGAVTGRDLLRRQTIGGQMLLTARQKLLGLAPEKEVDLAERLRSITTEELHGWTRQWLDPARMATGVLERARP